jgi:hypothetical protein
VVVNRGEVCGWVMGGVRVKAEDREKSVSSEFKARKE